MGADQDRKLSTQASQHPDTLLGGTAIKPVGWDRTGWEAIKYLIWNPETGQVLTRTPLSWLKIFVFYCIYYGCLAAFWAAMLNIFFITIPPEHPKWMLKDSIIGINPGLGVKPANQDQRIDSGMFILAYTGQAATSEKPTKNKKGELGEGDKNIDYAHRLNKFIESGNYGNKTGLNEGCADDKYWSSQDANAKPCAFQLSELGSCQPDKEGHFGYVVKAGQKYPNPCMILKFNRIFDWKPEAINETDLEEKPYIGMPTTLKDQIKKNKNHVWVECHGRNPADKELLDGNIKYYPENQGINFKYFPYKGNKMPYHTPLVAIQIKSTKAMVGRLMHIQCKAWFKGVKHNKKEKMGMVQFEYQMLPEDVFVTMHPEWDTKE